MPDEAYGSNSQMTVALERLVVNGSISAWIANLSVSELVYDFSIPAPHESYQSQVPV